MSRRTCPPPKSALRRRDPLPPRSLELPAPGDCPARCWHRIRRSPANWWPDRSSAARRPWHRQCRRGRDWSRWDCSPPAVRARRGSPSLAQGPLGAERRPARRGSTAAVERGAAFRSGGTHTRVLPAFMRSFLGTSGFSYKEWKGSFFPSDLPSSEMLRFYGERFNSVEINNSFYRMPSSAVLGKWAEEVPSEFVFVLKAPRSITHQKQLHQAG